MCDDNNLKKAFFSELMDLTFKKGQRIIRLFILIILISLFFFIGFIPTKSMEPTLKANSMVLFSKDIDNLKRGDIVSFCSPIDNEIYVKRVMGLPGERISVNEGVLIINGIPLEKDYTDIKPMYITEEVLLNEGEYWVLGDNRNNSIDSSEFGAIKLKMIRGKGVLVLMPFGEFGLIE